MRAPVFIYHGLHLRDAELADLAGPERRYSLPLLQFCRQLAWLSEHDISCALLDEPASPGVRLTFDDGHRSNYTHVFPLLERYGFRATFFIVAGWIGRWDRVGISELREMDAAGMAIGSHGLTHALLPGLPAGRVNEELVTSKDILEQVLGKPVVHFAAPGGAAGQRVIRNAFDAGYRYVCTSEPGWHTGGPVVPRLSITSHTSPGRFALMARGSRTEAGLARAGYLARQAIKRAVGIGGYEKLLEWISAGRGRESACR